MINNKRKITLHIPANLSEYLNQLTEELSLESDSKVTNSSVVQSILEKHIALVRIKNLIKEMFDTDLVYVYLYQRMKNGELRNNGKLPLSECIFQDIITLDDVLLLETRVHNNYENIREEEEITVVERGDYLLKL